MATDTVDTTAEILQRIRQKVAETRKEVRTLQESVIDVARMVSRMDQHISDVERRMADAERRVGEIKPDLETMSKMEFLGVSNRLDDRFEQQTAELKSHIDARLDQHLEDIKEVVRQGLQGSLTP